MAEEHTFALIKSHAAQRDFRKKPEEEADLRPPAQRMNAIVEAVQIMIIREHLTISASRWLKLSRVQIDELYREHLERPFFQDLASSVSGHVFAMILSGDNAIQRWRELLGATNPAKAAPNTIRAMFGDHHKVVDNVAHGSDSQQAAWREIRLFFPDFRGPWSPPGRCFP